MGERKMENRKKWKNLHKMFDMGRFGWYNDFTSKQLSLMVLFSWRASRSGFQGVRR